MDPRWAPIERTFTVTSPAVATGFSVVPNTASGWLIRTLRFQFVTDVNVANRALMFAVTDGNAEWWRSSAGDVQAASLTRIYGAHIDSSGSLTLGTFIGIRWPQDGLWIPKGSRLDVTIENVQAGDQISAIGGSRFEFPVGPQFYVWPAVATFTEESE